MYYFCSFVWQMCIVSNTTAQRAHNILELCTLCFSLDFIYILKLESRSLAIFHFGIGRLYMRTEKTRIACFAYIKLNTRARTSHCLSTRYQYSAFIYYSKYNIMWIEAYQYALSSAFQCLKIWKRFVVQCACASNQQHNNYEFSLFLSFLFGFL